MRRPIPASARSRRVDPLSTPPSLLSPAGARSRDACTVSACALDGIHMVAPSPPQTRSGRAQRTVATWACRARCRAVCRCRCRLARRGSRRSSRRDDVMITPYHNGPWKLPGMHRPLAADGEPSTCLSWRRLRCVPWHWPPSPRRRRDQPQASAGRTARRQERRHVWRQARRRARGKGMAKTVGGG